MSQEGTTQGDTLAMSFYGICVKPIIDILRQKQPSVYQVWLADDATAASKLSELKQWWKAVIEEGKKYGYHVKPSKSWLILKDPARYEETKTLFQDIPINITLEGKRHLGAALGTEAYKTTYIEEKVSEWCNRLSKLSDIAKSQPHAAYAAFTHGEQHRYTYFMRTLHNISENLKPIDKVLEEQFLPALFGREITDDDRELLALPVKEGGLGIRRIHDNSQQNYATSKHITTPLIIEIIKQSDSLPDEEDVTEARSDALAKVREDQQQQIKTIQQKQTPELQRKLAQITEPGASSWLGALPLSQYGFDLGRGEFQDALCLRYNKNLKNLPSKCPSGSQFTYDNPCA